MIFIGLGTNLPSCYGDSCQTLEHAKAAMRRHGITILCSAGYWKSAPVPVSDQPWFTNSVVSVSTDISPQKLLACLKDIEVKFGRNSTEKNAARVLDLDILDYQQEVCDDPFLSLPHPKMHERGFVLLPLQQIAAEWVHPVNGLRVETLVARLPDSQIKNTVLMNEAFENIEQKLPA